MRRREFITLAGGATLAWPIALRAQQSERVPRVGVLIPLTAGDSEAKSRATAFLEGLGELGWIDGKNVHIEYRWSGGDADGIRKNTAELVALAPDIILANVVPLLQATRTIPIVFVNVVDPISAGFVASLAKPGGNVTGFSLFEYSISGKWLVLCPLLAQSRHWQLHRICF